MAQSNGDEKLREKIQDICDRIHAGLLPPTGAMAIMKLIQADRKQHELEARIDELYVVNFDREHPEAFNKRIAILKAGGKAL